MRPLLLLPFVLAAGCTDQSGTFEVRWHVPGDSTCDSAKLESVSVVVTELESGHAETYDSTCLDGGLTTNPLPLGDYELTVTVWGTWSDRVDTRTRYARLAYDGQIKREPSIGFVANPPVTQLRNSWRLNQHGTPSTCAALGNPDIVVVTQPMRGTSTTDVWSCDSVDGTIEVPYGPLVVTAAMFTDPSHRTMLGTPSTVEVPAGRGLVTLDLMLDAVSR
jgi:hypothetical protein